MPGPEEYNHPQLAYVVQATAAEKPKIVVVRGTESLTLELSTAMLWNLSKDVTEALWRIYGPSKPPRDNY